MMRFGRHGSIWNLVFSTWYTFPAVVTTTLFSCRPTMSLSSLASRAASTTTSTSCQVCIVGGGVSGCAAAASLLKTQEQQNEKEKLPISVTLLEMGRGVGGRASTRFSRDDSRISINHGAPHADIQTPRGLAIMKQLQAAGFAKPSSLQSSSEDKVDKLGTNTSYWTGNPTMHRISEGLLEPLSPPPNCLFRSMARHVEPLFDENKRVQGWCLKDKDGETLVTTEWLVVAGSGMAHPRWTAAFGGDPPLLTAAQQLINPKLDRALDTIGKMEARPVQAALMAFDLVPADTNSPWDSFPESGVLETPEDSVLEKLVLQKNIKDNLISVVAHSNAAFAEMTKDVHGSKSTAAQVGGINTSSADREKEVLDTLVEAVERVLKQQHANIKDVLYPTLSWGPFLHRWGNAFPKGTALSLEDAIVEDAKIAFCGDYVGAQERFGTLEGALLSGDEIGQRLRRIIQEDNEKVGK